MSINDMLDANLMPVFLIIAIIFIVALPIGIAVGKANKNSIYGDNDTSSISIEKDVKILARRSSPNPISPTVMVNTVVFELKSGSRVELAIKNQNAFGLMVEGDCGTLKYQGKRFISFDRSEQ
ncbi:MAG: DUF2500 domain-containing protein [Clostridia bacterium]|nr:DUF2500 domain-containing protein [Clostridia bacterium]